MIELRITEEQRADACADRELRKLSASWLVQVGRQIAKVEALIEALLEEQAALADPVRRLDAIMGVARLTAVLVLAALPASRSNHLLKPFYDRLIASGKPSEVALTAVMRKLIVLMDHLLKNPDFVLAH